MKDLQNLVHLDYNSSTHQLINKEILGHSKSSSYWINTSRGGIIDDQALLSALKEKQIAGAALDVLEGEPEVKNNALIDYSKQHRNLIITPHIGGNTYESFEKTELHIFKGIERSLAELGP